MSDPGAFFFGIIRSGMETYLEEEFDQDDEVVNLLRDSIDQQIVIARNNNEIITRNMWMLMSEEESEDVMRSWAQRIIHHVLEQAEES
jgi:hypothetical protein